MKILDKYFQNRTDKIIYLLKKQRELFSPSDFHQLRVEIKKLKALFDLIKFDNKDFKRNKYFRKYNTVFKRAGKVRELQIEEEILKNCFQGIRIKEYLTDLKSRQLIESDRYFSTINNKLIEHLKKNKMEIHRHLRKLNKKNCTNFIDKETVKINLILSEKKLTTIPLHKLRKQIKEIKYLIGCMKSGNKNFILLINDLLTDLLGSLHDCQVTLSHLQKIVAQKLIAPVESDFMNDIILKLALEKKKIVDQIKNVLPFIRSFEN